jgi:hypothetical protein
MFRTNRKKMPPLRTQHHSNRLLTRRQASSVLSSNNTRSLFLDLRRVSSFQSHARFSPVPSIRACYCMQLISSSHNPQSSPLCAPASIALHLSPKAAGRQGHFPSRLRKPQLSDSRRDRSVFCRFAVALVRLLPSDAVLIWQRHLSLLGLCIDQSSFYRREEMFGIHGHPHTGNHHPSVIVV